MSTPSPFQHHVSSSRLPSSVYISLRSCLSMTSVPVFNRLRVVHDRVLRLPVPVVVRASVRLPFKSSFYFQLHFYHLGFIYPDGGELWISIPGHSCALVPVPSTSLYIHLQYDHYHITHRRAIISSACYGSTSELCSLSPSIHPHFSRYTCLHSFCIVYHLRGL